ncbi:hypothetical protein ACQKKK_10905 [Peribacillus sp. NPDC006672]|uniref:hypothetical protein n=1 Tax=Peribacillus sp. NPDC006672 TaxID=3390606 RepID=UPI003D00AA6E
MLKPYKGACEASIDLVMHIVAEQKFGLPQTSRDAFDMPIIINSINMGPSTRYFQPAEPGTSFIVAAEALIVPILKNIVEKNKFLL